MNQRLSTFMWRFSRVTGVCLLLLAASAVVFAQKPYADAPVFISENGSTRALVNAQRIRQGNAPLGPTIIAPGANSRVTVYVTNVELLKDEGATAFRAFVEDGSRRQTYLTVESISPLPGREWVQAVQLRLNGAIGDVGDVLVALTWRGMMSNRVRLAIGHAGGGPPDDENAGPTPMPLAPPRVENAVNLDPEYIGLAFSPDRIRFMEQATFGPSTDVDLRLRRIGLSAWIADQMTIPYPTTPYPNVQLLPIFVPPSCTGDCIRDNYTPHLLQRWLFTEATYGQSQLRLRVTWALHHLLVVSANFTREASWMLQYIKVLQNNAFGNYRQLLQEMTLNPAMGNYLDMIRSTAANPNENYAREILQLFSIGLSKLNQDGTYQCVQHNPCQPGDSLIPTYDQNVVNGFTKVFTGWTTCNSGPPNCPNSTPGIPNYIDPMVPIQPNHDSSSKQLLDGVVLPPGQSAQVDLTAALDNIFFHPNVGPFVSKGLIQQLVTSDPTPAYVSRVAAVFNNNGLGVRGDMAAVIRTILMDPEARGNVKTDPNYGHLREPALLMTGMLRGFNARAASGFPGTQSDGYVNNYCILMGQAMWAPPSVFSYYPPDFIVPASSPAVLGPEFGLYTTTAALRRPTVVWVLATSTIPAIGTSAPFGTSLDLSEITAWAAADTTGAILIEGLNQKLLHGTMSQQMRTSIATALTAIPTNSSLFRAQTALYLVYTSAHAQVLR